MSVRFGIGADDGLVHQLLDHDDHPAGGERRFLLHAEEAPDLGVALGVGALGVDDRHVGVERRHGGEHLAGVGTGHRPDRAD